MIGTDARPFAADLFELLGEAAVFLSKADTQSIKLIQEALDHRQDYEDGLLSLDKLRPLMVHITDYMVESGMAEEDDPLDISPQYAANEDEALQQYWREMFIEQQQDGPLLTATEIAEAKAKADAETEQKEEAGEELPRSNLYIDISPTVH